MNLPIKSHSQTTVDSLVDTYYQQRFLRVLLLALIAILLGQTVYFVYVGALLSAGFNCMIILSLWVARAVLEREQYPLASSLTVLSLLALLLFSILLDGLSSATTFWFFAFPVIATFLKGKHDGSIWLLSVVLVMVALYLASELGYIATQAIEYEAATFFQLVLAIFLVAIFVYVYQDHLDKKVQSVANKETQLSSIYTQLQDEIKHRKAVADSLDENLQILSRQKAQDEALLQSIGEGVIATDHEGEVILVNDMTKRLFNYYEKQVLGESHEQLFQLFDEEGNSLEQGQNPLMKTLSDHESCQTSKYYYRDYNQQLVPVAITTSPVELEGEVVGAIEVFRDITQERAAAKAKDEFLSLASHQLRTPLSAIRWYAERLLKTSRMKQKNRSYLEAIYEDSARMSSLLSDYLNASRLELKTTRVFASSIAPSEVIDDVLEDLQPMVKEKKLEILRHEQDGCSLQTDKHLLEMILQNLISNAVKYTPQNGTVTISTQSYTGKDPLLKDGIVISVEDTGIGIPPKEQVNVFNKLFRADNAASSDIEGTGLGLYTVKQAVERLDGKIWFESHPDKGTHFAVTLPPLDSDTMNDKEEEK